MRQESRVLRKLIGVTVILCLIAVIALLQGSRLVSIVRFDVFAAVLFLTLAISSLHLGPKVTFAGLASAVSGWRSSKVSAREFELFGSLAPGWAMTSANIIFILGFIRVLSQLTDFSRIGEGITIAVISYFYGFLFSGILASASGAKSGGKSEN